jgi:hypothetical protein
VHDAALDQSRFDSMLDRTGRPDTIDGAHVQAVPTLGRLAGVRHSQRGPEDCCLDVVHGHGVASEHRLNIPVADEPLKIGSRPGVYQRRSDDPHQISLSPFLLTQPRGELLVVDRTLAADFRGHEAKLVRAVSPTQKASGVHHDPLAAVLGLAHGDEVAALQSAWLDGLQQSGALDYYAIHPRPDRRQPLAVHPDVGRKIRRREKSFRQHPVGRQRREMRVGRAGEGRLIEIRQ